MRAADDLTLFLALCTRALGTRLESGGGARRARRSPLGGLGGGGRRSNHRVALGTLLALTPPRVASVDGLLEPPLRRLSRAIVPFLEQLAQL